ncbi:hypothetical protein BFP97_11215 [Roseivirga sp. 4D4]|uniref:hypothetical protein n=1 Tax=Roseivirga sp. 4D4 TaxID=1889784 RepID=UPI0008536C3B|nr:hypothetical protein [Roseivirga sp. 4D4]OEK02055.1 hypothetical protein BFP97_11215 [Roseivirga sp. 4D4]
MKKLITLLFFVFLGTSAFAQDLSKPQKGNAIRLKDYTITLKQGEETTFDMWVVKARKYKLNLGAATAKGKDGIDFWFNNKSSDPITYGVRVKVDENTPVGNHMFVLKVDGNGRNAVKSTTLMVKVISAEEE